LLATIPILITPALMPVPSMPCTISFLKNSASPSIVRAGIDTPETFGGKKRWPVHAIMLIPDLRETFQERTSNGARCAMPHSFGAQSRMSRNGQCRVILWMDNADPPILFRPELHSIEYVMVSIVALKDAVFRGIDRFLIKLYKDPKSKEAQLADKRLQSFVHKMPTGEVMSGTQ
jgi:hypothetical protein